MKDCIIRVGINARYLYDYNLRGFNRYTVCLVKGLQEIGGVELLLFINPRWPLHPVYSRLLGSSSRVAAPAARKALAWEQIVLPGAIRRQNVQVFHGPADGGLPAWRTCRHVLTYHRAMDKSVRYWITHGELPGVARDYGLDSHGIAAWPRRVRHDLLRRLYLRSADKIIAVSQFGKWELVELLGVPEHKVEVIYLAADDCFSPDLAPAGVEEARAKYRLPCRYLLFVGGFDPWKNVDGLIRVFADVHTRLEERLVLVGIGGDLGRLRAMAAKLGLEEGHDVLFLERIHEDLPALYHGATAFITLSWGESFSLPVVEAMSCGVPVIASQYGAIPEVLDGAGILVDPRATDQVHAAILAVAGDGALRTDLRRRGLTRARAFSWRQTARHTLQVYEAVLGGTGRAASC